jgi:NADPH:quinone reductase-like Zn-dependent oxidoreductase
MTTAVVARAYGGPEVLALVEVADPVPGPGEVVVEVRAAGVNPIDWKLYSGDFGTDPAKLPMRLGLEVAGVVRAVGPGAVGPAGAIAVGDEVVAPRVSGGYATAVTAPADSVFPKPGNLDWGQAAGLVLAGATAAHLVEATGVGPGDTVLVHGASGGVGLTTAQLARARGAQVVGTASERHHHALRGYGVVPVAYGPGLGARVREAAPQGVTVALDTVGTDEAVDVSLDLVPDRGRIATIVAFGRAAKEGFRALGGGPGADPGTELRRAARGELLRLAGDGALSVVVAHQFPLAEAGAAHELVRAGHAGGKVVLEP